MRMTQTEREAAMTDFNGHYEELLKTHPAWEIEPGFGLVQLRAQEATYLADCAAIDTLNSSGMPAKRAQRDALFGVSPADTEGVWIYLTLYKGAARLQLSRFAPRVVAKSLSSTTPNVGDVSPGAYDSILRRYIEHWTLVNAALPADKPLVIGPFSLAATEARRVQIALLAEAVDETVITRLAVMRAEREQLFGDVREDNRENDSIVAHLEAYRIEVLTQFAGTPLAATCPKVFPEDSGTGEVKFPFNFRTAGTDVVVWFEMPDEVTNAAVVYLKEGAFEETRAIPVGLALKITFSGLAVQGEVDDVELRNAAGKTVAHGKLAGALVEPV